MENVFLFSIDDAKAKSGIAIQKGCELETLLPFIRDEIQVENLRNFYPDGQCHILGVQERGDNLSIWDIMAEGDLVLGYQGRSIAYASYVLMKTDNPSLAAMLWSKRADEPFRRICFTDKPHAGEVPIVHQMLMYLEQDCMNFTKLRSGKRDNILRDYGSFEIFVRLGLGYDFPFNLRHTE